MQMCSCICNFLKKPNMVLALSITLPTSLGTLKKTLKPCSVLVLFRYCCSLTSNVRTLLHPSTSHHPSWSSPSHCGLSTSTHPRSLPHPLNVTGLLTPSCGSVHKSQLKKAMSASEHESHFPHTLQRLLLAHLPRSPLHSSPTVVSFTLLPG